MRTRRLGRTGHQTSLAILGGITFHFLDGDDVPRVLNEALDAGVNHLDVAPGYLTAEEKLGPHLAPVRDRLFLAEKSAETTRDGVRRQLEQTLQRLRVDSVDLYQLHGVIDLEDLDNRTGAAHALAQAREEGLCRWIGVTGHGVGTAAAQVEAVRRYDLDTVMLPVYPALWAVETYRTAAEKLLAVAVGRDLGVMVIKAAARRPWPADLPAPSRSATTWYEPHSRRADLERGIRFALSTPGVTGFCTPGDARLLTQTLEIAKRYTPMTSKERATAITDAGQEDLIFPIPS